MDPLTEIYNKLYHDTYSINAVTKQIYFIFFRPLIEKYLADPIDYNIYISTDHKLYPSYESSLPNNDKLQYVNDTLVPTTIPMIGNIIYIYHQQTKPTKQEQFNLINFIDTHINIKYIYIGSLKYLLPVTIFRLFRYSLHFETTRRRWGGFQTGFSAYKLSRQLCNKYHVQLRRKKTAKKSFTIYDYFLFHDNTLVETKLIRFNNRIQIIKKKKAPLKQVINTDVINQPPKIEAIPTIKYIYTNYNNPTHLIMPDGSKENYKNVVNKYLDVIDI